MHPVLLLFLAAALPPGQVIEKVQCERNPAVSYAVYLPSNYTDDRAWPILYCLDPVARGRVPVDRFAKAAEAEGFIVVGSNNSRNGPIEPVRESIAATVDDTHTRFKIDDRRVYAAGFSGGSRVALGWALNGSIAGVVACGAGFTGGTPKNAKFPVYAAAGTDDFNYYELYQLSLDLQKSGIPNRFAEFSGGHEWLPELQALEALRFFNGKLPASPAVKSKQVEKEKSEFDRLENELSAADEFSRASLLNGLKRDAASSEDSLHRRVARRVLGLERIKNATK